jgi:MoaD family protein
MKLMYFAILRDVTGKKEEDWPQPEATVGDLIRDLVVRYGHAFERWVTKDGDLWSLVIILVNGRDVRQMQRFATPLAPADVVVIFPPMGGG